MPTPISYNNLDTDISIAPTVVLCALTVPTFGDDFKVRFPVDLYSSLLNARSSHCHFLRVSRLSDCHQVWTLGDVLFGELDGDFVLSFHTGHVDT